MAKKNARKVVEEQPQTKQRAQYHLPQEVGFALLTERRELLQPYIKQRLENPDSCEIPNKIVSEMVRLIGDLIHDRIELRQKWEFLRNEVEERVLPSLKEMQTLAGGLENLQELFERWDRA